MQTILTKFNKFYPMLKKIGKNGLYSKIGSLLVGVEFEKSRYDKSYSPYIIITGLWGNDISNYRGNDSRSCLNSPDIHIRLKNSDGVHFSLSKESNQSFFENISSHINNNFLKLDNDVLLESLIRIIDNYKFHTNIISGSSGALAIFLEFKLILSIAINENELKKHTLDEIYKSKDDWNMEHFELWIGNYKKWITSLEAITKEDVLNSTSKVTHNKEFADLNTFKIT